jgi:hypothetical protein
LSCKVTCNPVHVPCRLVTRPVHKQGMAPPTNMSVMRMRVPY